MNEWQKELVKVAGEMSTSKERIKERILRQQPVLPKRPIRFALLTVVLTLCLAGFIMVQLLNKDTKQAAQMFSEKQFEHFEHVVYLMWPEQGEEFSKKEAYQKYEQLVAYYYFAKSLGITITKEELEAEKKARYDELIMLQDSSKFRELFQGLGLKQYFNTYIEPMIPFYAARKELNAFYEKKYPTLARTADQIAARDALRYFQINFAEQSVAFQEKIGIDNRTHSQGSIYVGTVIKIEDNAFLFVEGAIPEDLTKLSEERIIKKYNNATWYPILDDSPVKVGDYISLESPGSMSYEENGVEITNGFINSIEWIEPTITKKLIIQNEQEIIQFFQQTDWQTPDNNNMKQPPEYSFMLEGVRVDVWLSYGQTLYLQKVESGAIHLNQKRSEQLKSILGLQES